MAINKKLIHFKNKQKFEELANNNQILDTSIVFIQDSKEISTHGTLYKSVNWSVLEDPFNGYEYVDLGLPSGILWAKCDVGAEKESDYGLFFQWGDVIGYRSDQVGSEEGKKYFDWDDYKHCNGSVKTLTKYNTDSFFGIVDNLITLELSDDAASVNMGGSWRMPSNEEYEELINNTTNTWTTINGVNGILFTSRTNGNTLFFPASGGCDSGYVGSIGSYGRYWSSSLGSQAYSAYFFRFNLQSVDTGYDVRTFGCAVRGIINLNN